MDNWKIATDATTTSLKSAGSAVKENEKYITSITGRYETLKTTMQEVFAKGLSADTIKSALSGATTVVENFNKVLIITGVILATMKGGAFLSFILSLPAAMRTAITSTTLFSNVLRANASAALSWNLVTSGAVTGVRGVLSALGATAMGVMGTLKAVFLANPVGWISIAVGGVMMAMDSYNQKQEEIKQKTEQTIQKIEEERSALADMKKQYTEVALSGDYSKASKDKLLQIQTQLIKTYGEEAKGLDLINGKYKENAKIIDEISVKKAKAEMAAMELQRMEAEKAQKETSKEQFTLPKGMTMPNLEGLDVSEKAAKLSGRVSSLDQQINQKILQVNGTLEQRKKILETLIDRTAKLIETEEKQGRSTGDLKNFLSDLTGQFASTTDAITKNNTVLTQYAELEKIPKFFGTFKNELEDINKLIADKSGASGEEKTAIEKKLSGVHQKMLDIAKEKGILTEMKVLIDSYFDGETEAVNKASNALNVHEVDQKELTKTIKETREGMKDFNQAIDDVKKGHKLTGEQAEKLIDIYPELRVKIKETSKGFEIEKSVLEDARSKYENYRITAIKAQYQITDDTLKNIATRIGGYNSELNSIKDLASAQAAIANIAQSKLGASGLPGHSGVTQEDLVGKDAVTAIENYGKYLDQVKSLKTTVFTPEYGLTQKELEPAVKKPKTSTGMNVAVGEALSTYGDPNTPQMATINRLIVAAAKKYGVDPNLVKAIMKQESSF